MRSGEHLLQLINDILELSKIEAGRASLKPVHVNIFTLLNDILLIYKQPASQKHLNLVMNIDRDVPEYLVADDLKLRRILINLIGNAIKFTDTGGITIRMRFEQKHPKSGILIFQVEDSGQGIAEDELDKLFIRFEQTSSGIEKSSGSGLGLALCKELVTLMGGEISAASKIGTGSVFTFSIPSQIGRDAVLDKMNPQIVGIQNKKKDFSILVADDNADNREIAVRFLGLAGFGAIEAVNGADTIDKFTTHHPDLVLMDIRMPDMSGYAAYDTLRSTARGKTTPVIALTASSFNEERNKIENMGFDGYIRKPFHENEFYSVIARCLHIEYEYAGWPDEESRLEGSFDKKNFRGEITILADSWTKEMLSALEKADFDRLIELVGSIRSEHGALAAHLAELADNFDYNSIHQLLTSHNDDHEKPQ